MAEVHRIRSCCAAGRYGGPAGFLEPADEPVEASPWSGAVLGEIEIAPVRVHSVAVHEAAHAVFAHGLGLLIERVNIDGQPDCRWLGNGLDPAARVAITLAGHIGQNWASKLVHRPGDVELGEFVDAVKTLCFGGCDYCQSMLVLVRLVGANAPNEAFVAAYREIEVKVIEIVRRPDIWHATSDLAEELMNSGTINGDRAHEIAERYVRFGCINIGD